MEKNCDNCRKELGSPECTTRACSIATKFQNWEPKEGIKSRSRLECEDITEYFDTQQKIDALFNNFKEFLKEKNKRYGDSALSPQKIFSKQKSGSQICNRIDDKLGRIKKNPYLRKNDVSDLFGYVALLLIENEWIDFEDLLD